jgi:hypothetical protein
MSGPVTHEPGRSRRLVHSHHQRRRPRPVHWLERSDGRHTFVNLRAVSTARARAHDQLSRQRIKTILGGPLPDRASPFGSTRKKMEHRTVRVIALPKPNLRAYFFE